MYWRAVKEAAYEPAGSPSLPHSRARVSYVHPGQMDRFTEQMKKVAEVYKQKKYSGSFSMATRWGETQGANAVTFTNFANWAFWDEDIDFVKDFDEVHGAGAYTRFMEELDLCVDHAKTYDQISDPVPDLGS